MSRKKKLNNRIRLNRILIEKEELKARKKRIKDMLKKHEVEIGLRKGSVVFLTN